MLLVAPSLLLFVIYLVKKGWLKLFFPIPIGIILSLLSVYLSESNPVPFADISDAATYVLMAEKLVHKSLSIGDIAMKLGVQYIPFVIILSFLYVASLFNHLVFVLSTYFLNILLIFWSLYYLSKNLKIKNQWLSYLLYYNPGIFLISISTIRDPFIFFFSTILIVELIKFSKNYQNYKKIIFAFLGLSLFRFLQSIVIIITFLIGNWFGKMTKPRGFIGKFIVVVLTLVVLFLVMLLILPTDILRIALFPSFYDTEFDRFLVETFNLVSDNRINAFLGYMKYIAFRLPFTLIGRGPSSDVFVIVTNVKAGFYYSNGVKSMLMFLYDSFRLMIFFPLLLITLSIWKRKLSKTDFGILLSLILLYVIMGTIYTIKFYGFQPRIRVFIEIMILAFCLNIYSKYRHTEIAKSLALSLYPIFSVILVVAEFLYRIGFYNLP